jgi:hypothetical protein
MSGTPYFLQGSRNKQRLQQRTAEIAADERRGDFLRLVEPARLNGAELSLRIEFAAVHAPHTWWNPARRALVDALRKRLASPLAEKPHRDCT